MEQELWIDIRDAIIDLLKISDTNVGDHVRLGRLLPLGDPSGIVSIPDEDEMPLAIVGLVQVDILGDGKTRANITHEREPVYGIDIYIPANRQQAEASGLPVDEYIDIILDSTASQFVNAIEYYARFRCDSAVLPQSLALNNQAIIWVTNVQKNYIEQTNSTIIGVVSIQVHGLYHQARQIQPVFDMDELHEIVKIGTIEKVISFNGLTFVQLTYINSDGVVEGLTFGADQEALGFYTNYT